MSPAHVPVSATGALSLTERVQLASRLNAAAVPIQRAMRASIARRESSRSLLRTDVSQLPHVHAADAKVNAAAFEATEAAGAEEEAAAVRIQALHRGASTRRMLRSRFGGAGQVALPPVAGGGGGGGSPSRPTTSRGRPTTRKELKSAMSAEFKLSTATPATQSMTSLSALPETLTLEDATVVEEEGEEAEGGEVLTGTVDTNEDDLVDSGSVTITEPEETTNTVEAATEAGGEAEAPTAPATVTAQAEDDTEQVEAPAEEDAGDDGGSNSEQQSDMALRIQSAARGRAARRNAETKRALVEEVSAKVAASDALQGFGPSLQGATQAIMSSLQYPEPTAREVARHAMAARLALMVEVTHHDIDEFFHAVVSPDHTLVVAAAGVSVLVTSQPVVGCSLPCTCAPALLATAVCCLWTYTVLAERLGMHCQA